MGRGGKRKGAGRKAKAKAANSLETLSVRKQLYLKSLAEGNTKKQAAEDAGYAESTARAAKAHIETEDVKAAFAELIRAVVPSEKIAARIAEGLDAVETKLYAFQGMIFDREELVAWTERREYAKLAAEYGGYFVATQKFEGELDHSGEVHVTVEFVGDAAS